MFRPVFRKFAACGLLLAGAATANAQDPALESLYGRGVEAYFSGDYIGAFNLLTGAIQAGSTDPRVYYYRGLSELPLGRSPDANADFSRGAQLEAADAATGYDVGKSLERIQGRVRLYLEGYRSNARLVAAEAREKMRRQRYETFQHSAPAAAPGQAAGAAPPAAGTKPTAAPAAATPAAAPANVPPDPFAAPAAPATPPAAAPAEPAAPATPAAPANPFGAPPAEQKPATPPANPFGSG